MSSESFGMQAINLAGGEDAQESRNILGMMDRMTQSGGDVVKGVDNARFNQAIQKGDEYLQQMADELDVPPQVRDQMKFFTGSPDATKAGANYLMKWAEAEKAKKDFEYGMSLPGEFNKQFQEYSSKQFMGLGEGASKEDRDALTQRLKDEREFGLQNLKSQAKTEGEISGIERVLGQGGSDDWYKRAQVQKWEDDKKDRARGRELQEAGLEERKAKRLLGEKLAEEKFGREGTAYINKLLDVPKLSVAVANSNQTVKKLRNLNKAINGKMRDAFSFKLLDIGDIKDPRLIKLAKRTGLKEKELLDRINSSRNTMQQYILDYIKQMSGLAVTDAERRTITEALGAGGGGDFAQFMDAFNNAINKQIESIQELETIARRSRPDEFSIVYPTDADLWSNKIKTFDHSEIKDVLNEINSRMEGGADSSGETLPDVDFGTPPPAPADAPEADTSSEIGIKNVIPKKLNVAGVPITVDVDGVPVPDGGF